MSSTAVQLGTTDSRSTMGTIRFVMSSLSTSASSSAPDA
jgi:hypothetical protein